MAKLSDVQDAQKREADAIAALATALASLPKPAATEADLDGVVAAADANTAAVNALLPPVV